MPLLLSFRILDQAFALDAGEVLRVLPRVHFSPLPGAPDYVEGLMDLEGSFIPVLDLGRLLANKPCRRLFSTRIVVVRFPRGEGGSALLGLLVEDATEVTRVPDEDLAPPKLSSRAAPYLAAVGRLEDETAQVVRVSALLSADVADLLFDGISGTPEPKE